MCCIASLLEQLWEEGERGVESRGLVPFYGAALPTHTVNTGQVSKEVCGLVPLNGAALPTQTVNKGPVRKEYVSLYIFAKVFHCIN
jgi:hypothetical protein